jgi:hypothetical protein
MPSAAPDRRVRRAAAEPPIKVRTICGSSSLAPASPIRTDSDVDDRYPGGIARPWLVAIVAHELLTPGAQ